MNSFVFQQAPGNLRDALMSRQRKGGFVPGVQGRPCPGEIAVTPRFGRTLQKESFPPTSRVRGLLLTPPADPKLLLFTVVTAGPANVT